MKPIDVENNPHAELASAAIAIAFALRARGREDDQAAAQLLDRLGTRALMHLAGEVNRLPALEGLASAQVSSLEEAGGR